LNLPVEYGVLVVRVVPRSPAAQAGIRGGRHQVPIGNTILWVGGDVLVGVDGRKVESMKDIVEYLDDRKRVGETVELEILRDGLRVMITATLGELPEEFS
jgi:2-alkenal reductase